ncbi:MAG: DNA polymerase I [Bryobacteraceae bacterium]|nr:DNA polymerase I [Bryobacteraceae bacterium]
MTARRLFLIDSYGFIFRAYHARARSGAPPMRTSKGLPTEAIYIFNNMVRKLVTTYQPEYIAAVFESGKTFREEQFKEYKANRTEMPPDLGQQIPVIRTVLEAMRIPILEFPGFEADDVIGTLACQAAGEGLDVVIVSSDKDMLQLVEDRVTMMNPMKDWVVYDTAGVEAFMGVQPKQVADLLALKGDSVDNIPGAPGIGDKGAVDLIQRFGSVEAALDRAAEVERKTYRESLQNHREQVLLSKKLATIDTTVPLEWRLESVQAQPMDLAAVRQLYRELEFFSLLKQLGGPEETSAAREEGIALDYSALDTAEEVAKWAKSADRPIAVAFRAPEDLDGGGVGFSSKPGEGRVAGLDAARSVLEDGEISKAAHDVKSLTLACEAASIQPRGLDEDVMLYAFLLTAESGGCAMDTLSERYLGQKLQPSVEQQADCIARLRAKLGPQIDEQGLRRIYDEIDYPLTAVLAGMERTGIAVAPAQLQRLSEQMDAEIQRLTVEIHAMAGRPFNIGSPQQLGKVLFEELKLPAPVKMGKGKTISTAADVLEGLAEEFPVAAKVLEYRQLTKLKGTYVDALPQLLGPDGRVHTTFNQTGAATGRLSSSNPNLQNIPIRTELGREIRAAFVPRPGWVMVKADYSQIELRLLAHMSGDAVLVDAFRNGEDIHTRTAAEVFGVPPLMVNAEMRRNAKAVNFGIVYGQTPFGLAASLGISRVEAEKYIRAYFERYAGVRKWIDGQIAEVRKTGVTKTLDGRPRPIPDILSRNPNARGFAERTAVNTPLQGTAADIIKRAMIRIDRAMETMQAKMLLQVHDELVFEAPPEEARELGRLAKHEMENVVRLAVPLVVDVGTGPNWRDAK